MTFAHHGKSLNFLLLFATLLTVILTALPTYVLRQSQFPIINLPHTLAQRTYRHINKTLETEESKSPEEKKKQSQPNRGVPKPIPFAAPSTYASHLSSEAQGTTHSTHIICLSDCLRLCVSLCIFFFFLSPIVVVVVLVFVFVDCSLLPPSLSCLWLHFACCVCLCLCTLCTANPLFPVNQ